MNKASFYPKFSQYLLSKYPELKTIPRPIKFEHLFSPLEIELPKSIFAKASRTIQNIFKLTHSDLFVEQVAQKNAGPFKARVSNLGLVTAYDFHTREDELRLIEINTNAAGYLLCAELNEFFDTDLNLGLKPKDALLKSFDDEMQYTRKTASKTVTLIDENLLQQNMYSEFLLYAHLLKSAGYQVNLCDVAELKFDAQKGMLTPEGQECGFIYNRFCDFDFSEPRSALLLQSYLEGLNQFSPHPQEYLLVADKLHLVELSSPTHLQQFASVADIDLIAPQLLKTEFAQSTDAESRWQKRKTLFFKPRQSFGGKSAYRGANVSRKVFQRLWDENAIVQEYFPPPTLLHENEEWKYDIRFYVYQDQIQNVVARVYQGQVTNFAAAGGGFSRIKFV